MDEETQKRMVTILASGIAYVLASRLADRLIEEPERRGIADDAKEALLRAAFSLASTIVASFIVRRIVAGRWGG